MVSTADDNFATLMKKFVSDRGGEIDKISRLRVGWEAWAQVEISKFCSNKGWSFWREYRAYGDQNRLKADFVFHDNSGNVLLTMELKCATYRETPAHFAKRVSQDVLKLCANAQFKKAPVYVIGICPLSNRYAPTPPKIDAALELVYKRIHEKEPGITMFYENHHKDTQHKIGIWWWKGQFPAEAQETELLSEKTIEESVDQLIKECLNNVQDLEAAVNDSTLDKAANDPE